MTDNLPTRHPSEYADQLEAENEQKAVAVSQWRNSKAIAIGDNEKGEWLMAPTAVDLEDVR